MFCPLPISVPSVLYDVDKAELLSLIIGTPSTTYNGLLAPRTLTRRPAPGVPDGVVTKMPATLPCILCAILETG